MSEITIQYVWADETLKRQIATEWTEVTARHMHLEDGFTIVATRNKRPIGLISIRWQRLPSPLAETHEGYIDIIEVREGFRRQGIATHLIGKAIEQARGHSAYQLRAWSSADKTEAIPMWKALGFGLCPATTYPQGQEVRGYFVTRIL